MLLGGYEVVDGFNGIDVEDFVPGVTGLERNGGGEVSLAYANGAEEDGVVFVFDEA